MATKAELQASVTALQAEVESLRRYRDGYQAGAWLRQRHGITPVWGEVNQCWIWPTPEHSGLPELLVAEGHPADPAPLPPCELIELWRQAMT